MKDCQSYAEGDGKYNVKIVDFPTTPVAVLEHRGDPTLIEDSIGKFIAWRKQNHLSPATNATFNILYNSPTETAPADYRCDLCVATDLPIGENAYGIVAKTIPGGKCAVLRHIGDDGMLGESMAYLFGQWLPMSGEVPRAFPLFLQRVLFPPAVSAQEAIVDIFLPLQ
ncbi:AraC family transcriptional regulator [Alkalinema pantanalense CENA528]|uniref:AraC family transcriptional regulator n=1 Tax=Alkalinema pantanalense TaxID=1620705 RepID=UPI003D6F93D7